MPPQQFPPQPPPQVPQPVAPPQPVDPTGGFGANQLPDPYLPPPPQPKGRGLWIFFTVLFFLLAAGAGYLAYFVNNRAKTQLTAANAQTAEAQAKVSELETQVTTLKADNTSLEYINVIGIGARMKRSDALKNIVFFTNSRANANQPFTHFSTSEILGAVMLNPSGPFDINQCALSDSPLGAITRYQAGAVVSGKKVEDQLSDTVKKAGDFYYVYTNPTSSCTSNTSVSDVISPQQKAMTDAFKTIETLPATNLSTTN